METSDAVSFREVQMFGKWVWGVAALTGVIVVLVVVSVILALADSEENLGARGVLVLSAGALVVATTVVIDVLLIKSRLETEVRDDGVYVRFFPFHLSFRKIRLGNVVKVEARTYRPIREYGGWGIRWARRGRAYNMSGHVGVRVDCANGRHVLIGSRRAEELAAAIDRVRRNTI